MLLLAAEKRDRGRGRKEDIQAMGRSKWMKKITAVCINNETSRVVCKQRKIQP